MFPQYWRRYQNWTEYSCSGLTYSAFRRLCPYFCLFFPHITYPRIAMIFSPWNCTIRWLSTVFFHVTDFQDSLSQPTYIIYILGSQMNYFALGWIKTHVVATVTIQPYNSIHSVIVTCPHNTLYWSGLVYILTTKDPIIQTSQ